MWLVGKEVPSGTDFDQYVIRQFRVEQTLIYYIINRNKSPSETDFDPYVISRNGNSKLKNRLWFICHESEHAEVPSLADLSKVRLAHQTIVLRGYIRKATESFNSPIPGTPIHEKVRIPGI